MIGVAVDFLIAMGELGMLTGPSGVGKSALIKRFLNGLTPLGILMHEGSRNLIRLPPALGPIHVGYPLRARGRIDCHNR